MLYLSEQELTTLSGTETYCVVFTCALKGYIVLDGGHLSLHYAGKPLDLEQILPC